MLKMRSNCSSFLVWQAVDAHGLLIYLLEVFLEAVGWGLIAGEADVLGHRAGPGPGLGHSGGAQPRAAERAVSWILLPVLMVCLRTC